MNNRKLLEVKNLLKTFKVDAGSFSNRKLDLKAVNGVSFDVFQGETLGLVGESGCGKTTVGRLLLKLYESDGGQILYSPDKKRLDEIRVKSRSKEIQGLDKSGTLDVTAIDHQVLKIMRKEIQIIFQDPWASLNPRMLIKDIITEGPLELKMISKKDKNQYANKLLQQVGLPLIAADRYPHEFSGGQRQRIGIARALSVNPSLIICDEPVSALDVSVQAQILNLLLSLQQKYGLTYIFIAHDLSVVQYLSDRIAVMYLGHIFELGNTDTMIKNPKHPYTVSLMSSVPVADPEYKPEEIILEGDVPSPINPPSGCTFHPRCPKALDICSQKLPEFREISEKHFIACHNPY